MRTIQIALILALALIVVLVGQISAQTYKPRPYEVSYTGILTVNKGFHPQLVTDDGLIYYLRVNNIDSLPLNNGDQVTIMGYKAKIPYTDRNVVDTHTIHHHSGATYYAGLYKDKGQDYFSFSAG